MSPIDLQSHLAARSEVDPSSGCWNWKLSKDKNGYGNLGTPQENMDDKVQKGRWRGGPDCWDKSRLGEGHHKAKLNPEKVLQMREMLKERGISEVAKLFQVSAGAVYSVKVRKTWANVQGEQQ